MIGDYHPVLFNSLSAGFCLFLTLKAGVVLFYGQSHAVIVPAQAFDFGDKMICGTSRFFAAG